MSQNIYDDTEFFRGYKALRDEKAGLNEALEQPAMDSLMPDVRGLDILDMGCGAGDLCRTVSRRGARSVVGVDVSRNMLELARSDSPEGVQFLNCSIEDSEFDEGSFDLILSSLALHYVEDLENFFKKAHGWLRQGGLLIFSMEHPIATSAQGRHPGWITDEKGNKLYWAIDFYNDEGKRESHWFVDGVVKYHRMTSTILNSLIDAGFSLKRILEPIALPEHEKKRPSLSEERRRPPFLVLKALRS